VLAHFIGACHPAVAVFTAAPGYKASRNPLCLSAAKRDSFRDSALFLGAVFIKWMSFFISWNRICILDKNKKLGLAQISINPLE